MKFENGKPIVAKVNASFRCSAEVKQELTHQARLAGMEPSPYYEMLLINALKYKDEIRKLKSALANSEANLSNIVTKHAIEMNSLIKELEASRADNKTLQNQLAVAQNNTIVLGHPKLLQIFEHVKWKTNIVEQSDGSKLSIKYDCPADVVLAMIHSFDYKK